MTPETSAATDGPRYVQIERPEALVRCNECGAVTEGDVVGQNQHDIWHQELDQKIELAARWRSAPRIR